MGIGALARRTGCKVETVRYYEHIGVLPPPPRSPGGQRRYGEAHLKRLNFIRRARELGFTLDGVRALLDLADERAGSCAEVETIAGAHLDVVRDKLTDLERLETVLADLVARCRGGTVPRCPIIEALYAEAAPPKAAGGRGQRR